VERWQIRDVIRARVGQVFPIGSGATLAALTVQEAGNCKRVNTIGELQPESKEREALSCLVDIQLTDGDDGRAARRWPWWTVVDCGVHLLGY
jgi:hypothetical protein